MNAQDCLQCALAPGISPCGYDYALLKSLYGDSEKEDRRNEIHVTDLLGCPLKAYWDKTDPAPERPHEMLTRWMGTAVHKALEGSDEFMDSELKVDIEGITGRSDIVYKDGRLLDIKSTRWLYTTKTPYGSHAMQVNVYAYMLRKMGTPINTLQIQYIDMSGPTKCRACRVPVRLINGEIRCPNCMKIPTGAHLGAHLVDVPLMTDAEVEEVILGRKERLAASLEMGLAPAMEPGYLCGYCNYKDVRCFPDVTEE
jgi:CRISPR/Cas system-associated exonuclease Cas4 (RecB family)